MSNNNGYGYAYPDSPVEQVRPAAPPRPSFPMPASAPRPSYPKPAAPVVINRPTASLVRRPSTTPLRYVLIIGAAVQTWTNNRLLTHHVSLIKSRIDACIVGDPNACLEPNESCQVEEDGSACSCKPGFGRKKSSDVCKGIIKNGLFIVLTDDSNAIYQMFDSLDRSPSINQIRPIGQSEISLVI
jgi:hypothetical protein